MQLLLAMMLISGPFDAPRGAELGSGECWVQPLRITLADIGEFGKLGEAVTRDHCLSRWHRELPPRPFTSYVVAQTRMFAWGTGPDRIALGVDVVWKPGIDGRDALYATPALDLPDDWERVIDQATYPVLAVSTVAIVTAVMVELLR